MQSRHMNLTRNIGKGCQGIEGKRRFAGARKEKIYGERTVKSRNFTKDGKVIV